MGEGGDTTRGELTADSTGVSAAAPGAADTVATAMAGFELDGGATDAAMMAGGGGGTAGS